MRTLANNTAEGIGAGMIALYVIIGIVGLILTIYLIWVQVQIKNNTKETVDILKEILRQIRSRNTTVSTGIKYISQEERAKIFAENKAREKGNDK